MYQEILVKGKATNYPLPLMSPETWKGEADCVVGPFTSRDSAEYFVDVTTGWRLNVITRHLFASDNSWYVETEALP
jgi:hypothetical protein